MSNFKLWMILTLVVVSAGCDSIEERPHDPASTQRERGFVRYTYRDVSGHESKYIVFIPEAYDAQTPQPAILFLHGAGKVGNDGNVQAQGGLGAAIRNRQTTFPFITVFPQSHRGGWLADTAEGERALAILEEVRQRYNVDRERIYLTGYSMGGEGTWSLAAARPDLFTAIVPICPGRNIEAVPKLKNLPCWCFQGGADAPALVRDTRAMVLAIKQAGGRPIYQEYPDLEHNCWDAAYGNNDIYEWLLQQRKTSED
jgi:predicted peptidase